MTHIIATMVFKFRALIASLLLLLTCYLAYQATNLGIDAGFEKQLPLKHPYMQTFLKYQQEFGGANRLLIALHAREGDIFTPEFFTTLEELTKAVAGLDGVNQGTLRSLFTPNVRFIEIVEGGFSGGNVIPAEFTPTEEGIAQVRENILKAGIVGRLVANDFSAALVSAELADTDPNTGAKLNYLDIAKALEQDIRDRFSSDELEVHIIGFAKAMGDIADGAKSVVLFFAVAVLITFILVWLYTSSMLLTLLSITCSFAAVLWGLGLLTTFGFGLDPMSILVPFLIFAIAISHSIQIIGRFQESIRLNDATSLSAAESAFARLLQPGIIALVSDAVGFLSISLIEIRIIQELAYTASIGVLSIVITNLFLLPIILSYVPKNAVIGKSEFHPIILAAHNLLSHFSQKKFAIPTLALAAGIMFLLIPFSNKVQIGDVQKGVPELREDSRYNKDTNFITESFSISVDVITTIVETIPDACIDHELMTLIDNFQWQMQNVPGVQSTISLPQVAKIVNAGWNEGHLKWRELPRNPQTLVQSVQTVDTGTGLLNGDCSVMTVMIFLEDHKAETITRVTSAVSQFATEHNSDKIQFRLATGNAGVAAATNQVVESAQFEMLLYVYGAVVILCLLSFRSLSGTLCVILPLIFVSFVCYAAMSVLGIGLKVSTLPVAALGVGIGVDYGIYIYSQLQKSLLTSSSLTQAYLHTLKTTGTAVIVTGFTLTLGVATWAFSDLKFQADMGVLLAIMFFGNMLAALILIPALRALFQRK